MDTSKILKIINDSTISSINMLEPRAHKYVGENEKLLNGEWFFEYFPKVELRNSNFMNDSRFKEVDKIQVPGHIEMNGYGQIQYVNVCYPWDGIESVEIGDVPKSNAVGQYTKFISITASELENNKYISFEGVEQAFSLWVNGQFVGYATDSFTSSEFDISKYLMVGENRLSVEVYQYTAACWLEGQDFWRFFGIFRDVKLKSIRQNHIYDFSIKYNIDLISSLSGNVDCNIEVLQMINTSYILKIYYASNKIFEKAITKESEQIKLDNIKLWNAEIPELYNFVFETEEETFSHKIAFRKFEIIDNIVKLNGERIIFKGINRHEFSAKTGRAINETDIRLDIKLLKEHNFNAIRTSHYPNNPKFYELCDEYGIYVIDEMNLETHGTWLDGVGNVNKMHTLPDNDIRYRDCVFARGKNMYERDKNFYSILFWSLGNESYGGKILYDLSEYFRKQDELRLVHYEGTTWDRRYSDTTDVESRMYSTSEEISKYFDEGNTKPLILCEFSHAMGNSNGNFDDYIELEKKYMGYQGGFIWEYMDQAIELDGRFLYGGDFGDRPTDYNFICDGLVGPNREITDELQYIALQYSSINVTVDDNTTYINNQNIFKDEVITICFKNQEGTSYEEKRLIKANSRIQILCDNNERIKRISHKDKIIFNNVESIKAFSKINEKNVQFVDGSFHFGLQSENYSILFSKAKNNICSIKYDGQELFSTIEDGFVPNFWRAPTNNDIGSSKYTELAIWKAISYYPISKITDYSFNGTSLEANVRFTSSCSTEYYSDIKYVIKHDGSININLSTNIPESLPDMFCVGLRATLDPGLEKFSYLGNGPYASYCDRKENMVRDEYHVDITNENGYLVPQEYGNRTDVEAASINDKFNLEFNKLSELSLIQFSDNQLEHCKNRNDLVKEAPTLKINAQQSGVGGDDSWMSWCKDKYICKSGKKYGLEFIISKI